MLNCLFDKKIKFCHFQDQRANNNYGISRDFPDTYNYGYDPRDARSDYGTYPGIARSDYGTYPRRWWIFLSRLSML